MKRVLFLSLLSACTVFGQNQGPAGAAAQPTQPGQPQSAPKERPDGMDFYRRNTQLMKRYFPQYGAGYGGGVPAPGAGEAPGAAGTMIGEVRFSGGSARDLADLLARTVEPPPNILISPGMSDTAFPPFELHNVTTADLFQALNSLADNNGAKWQLSGSNEPIWVLNPPAPTAQPMPSPYYPVPVVDPLTGLPVRNNGPARTCQIFPIQRFLTEYKVEDITTSIQTAWEMTGEEKPADLKYHKDTKLLIAVGSAQQLGIISQVLKSLEEQIKEKEPKKTAMADPGRMPREVYVHGAVNKPGAQRLEVNQDVTLLAVIGRAGGLSNGANSRKIRFKRSGEDERVLTMDELKDSKIVAQPGDVIDIAEKTF